MEPEPIVKMVGITSKMRMSTMKETANQQIKVRGIPGREVEKKKNQPRIKNPSEIFSRLLQQRKLRRRKQKPEKMMHSMISLENWTQHRPVT